MDAARAAIAAGDLETAAQYGKVYRLVDVEPAVKPWRPRSGCPKASRSGNSLILLQQRRWSPPGWMPPAKLWKPATWKRSAVRIYRLEPVDIACRPRNPRPSERLSKGEPVG